MESFKQAPNVKEAIGNLDAYARVLQITLENIEKDPKYGELADITRSALDGLLSNVIIVANFISDIQENQNL